MVTGTYLARRGCWQSFTKQFEATNEAGARERALSEVGSSHHVKRSLVRLSSVVETRK
jgi:ribosomal protein L20A (L18A)